MNVFVSTIEKFGFLLFAFSVVAAPLPFGSNSSGFAGLFGLVIGLALVGSCALPQPRAESLRLIALTLLISGLVLILTVVQVLPAWSDDAAYPIWSQAKGLIDNSHPPISPARYQPLYSVGYVLLPLAVFVSALVYVRREHQYMRFIHTVLSVGSFITLLCLVQFSLTPGVLLWAEKQHYLGSFTGTFVNRNSAATYFGVLLVMSLALALRQMMEIRPHRLLLLRRSLARSERLQLILLAIYAFWTLVFASALFLTGSRAGVSSALVGLIGLLAAFTFFSLRPRLPLIQALSASVLCVAVSVVLAVTFGDNWLERFGKDGLFDVSRACAYNSTWEAIKDHFWLGTGLGTFQDVFPSYRLAECGIFGHWEMAHSIFIEGGLTLGVVFLVCLGILYPSLLSTYVQGLRTRRRWRFVPLASLAVLVVVTLHSIVDFSLQIPGVAILVASLLGAGASVSLGKAQPDLPNST